MTILHRPSTDLAPLHPVGAAGQQPALEQLAAALAASEVIGLDTEFMRERTYRAQLCLLQFSTPMQCHLVDPLDNPALPLFQAALGPGPVTKVMHAARQDLEVLWPFYGRVAPVFDTQLAAGLAGFPAQVGYAELVRRLLGVELDKSHTRTDWSRRPLSDAQLAYAREDVRHLLPLRELLLETLERQGRLAWLAEDLEHLGEDLFVDPEAAWLRLKGVQELDTHRQRLAQALAAWRERRAAEKDRPRSWILDDAGLRALIHRAPRDQDALRSLPELQPGFMEHSGEAVLALVESLALPARLPPLPGRRPPDPVLEQRLKQLGARLRERAATLELAPELLATRRDLEALATGRHAQSQVLQGWRREVIGAELVALL
ncbi:MAG: hypothetical protein RL026_2078 [Pseudomonadota bacterium]